MSEKLNDSPWKAFFEAVLEYKKVGPWDWMYDSDIFGIQNPETKENLYPCVMGNAGEVFGLFIYKGERGLNSLLQMSMGMISPDSLDIQHIQDGWLLSFDNRDDLTQLERNLLKEHNIKCRGKKAWPNIRRYDPGFEPWLPEEEDLPFLTEVIQQTIETSLRIKDGELELPDFDSEDILLRINKKGDAGWEEKVIKHEPYEATYKAPFLDEFTQHRLKKLKKSKNIFEVDLFYSPAPIKPNNNTRGIYPKILSVVDQASGMVINVTMQESTEEDPTMVFFAGLLEAIEKADFLPSEIQLIKPEVECLVSGFCEALEIEIGRTGFMEETENFKMGMFSGMMGGSF